MTDPLVSILITAYNAEPWLEETLDSATRQTWPRIEVVVVDDGSTDATLAIARRYESPNVRVIAQENGGACAARNRALIEAQGDFIQYLDADDILNLDKIELQIRQLQNEPRGTVATGPWARFYDDDLATADTARRAPDWKDYDPATDWLVESWEGRGTIPLFSWLIPRAVVEATGQWREDLLINQDGEYIARLLIQARRIAFVEKAWGFYRSGMAGSISRRRSDAALRSLYDANARCEQTLLNHLDTPDTRRACAGLWQQFLFAAYPRVPNLVVQAERRVEEFGGMYRLPGVSRPFRAIRDHLGWKPALRLQRFYERFYAVLRS